MIQYTTEFSHPAVTSLKQLSAQHNIELAELFQNLYAQSKHYAELVAELNTTFRSTETPL